MSTQTSKLLNGIDVEALQGAIEAVKADPAAGATFWKVRSEWVGGARADHVTEGTRIGGETPDRRFKLSTDEPLELCGTNEHANPQEYLMAGLNACMMVGYAAVAALMGIELKSLEVELEGDIDLRGFLGIDPSVARGYENLRQTVRISADASREQLEQLHATVQDTSPNFYNITRAIPTRSQLVVT